MFYTPRLVADSGSFSPSAAKPKPVVESWLANRLAIEIVEPRPVSIDQLARAHDRAMVEAVLAGTFDNGFGNRSPQVAASLPWTSGAMLSAARRALADGSIACAPVAGFHHATHRLPGSFCTFNGLMVAALALHVEDRVARVGILDYDHHYGDGTDDIIETLGIDWIDHVSAGTHYRNWQDAKRCLAELPDKLDEMRECDVVLYQAGADQHVLDPLGGVLTTEELAERDLLVFDTLASWGIPCAWNFAGGYQVRDDGSIPEVIRVHTNTAEAALSVIGQNATSLT